MAYDRVNYLRAAMIAVAHDNGVGFRLEEMDGNHQIEIDDTTSPQQVALAMELGTKPFLSLMVKDVHTQCGIALTPLVASLRTNGSELPGPDLLLPGLRTFETIGSLAREETAVLRMWSHSPEHDAASALLYYTARLAHTYAGSKPHLKRDDLSQVVARQIIRVMDAVDTLLGSEPTRTSIQRLAVILARGPAATRNDIQAWTVDTPARVSLGMMEWPWLEKRLGIAT